MAMRQKFSQIFVVPPSLEPFGLDASFGCFVLLE
jgi:hypothetical protein